MQINLSIPQTKVFIDTHRFRVLMAGRRFGKTFLAKSEIFKYAQKPNREILYIAPTYNQAKRLMFRPLSNELHTFAKDISKSTLEIELHNGTNIKCGGAGNYDAYRGGGYDFVIIDEIKDIEKEAYTDVVRPALSDREGSLLVIGTPDVANSWVEELTNSIEFHTYTFSTLEGGNVSTSEIEMARNMMDEQSFKREFLAQFVRLNSQVYYAFSKDNIIDIEYDKTLQTYITFDFNINPFCVSIIQVKDDIDYVVKEFYMRNTNTYEVCNAILEYFNNDIPKDTLVTGDYSGNAGATAGRSDYEIIRTQLRLPVKISVVRHIKDRVASLNARLRNANGVNKMYIDRRCKHLIEDLYKTEWKNNQYILDATNKDRTHASDALSYYTYNFRKIRNIEVYVR